MADKKQTVPSPERKAAGDKKSALETALSQIEKQFGKGAVMKLGQDSTLNVEAISTGSLSLDIALGQRGPRWKTKRLSPMYPVMAIRGCWQKQRRETILFI